MIPVDLKVRLALPDDVAAAWLKAYNAEHGTSIRRNSDEGKAVLAGRAGEQLAELLGPGFSGTSVTPE